MVRATWHCPGPSHHGAKRQQVGERKASQHKAKHSVKVSRMAASCATASSCVSPGASVRKPVGPRCETATAKRLESHQVAAVYWAIRAWRCLAMNSGEPKRMRRNNPCVEGSSAWSPSHTDPSHGFFAPHLLPVAQNPEVSTWSYGGAPTSRVSAKPLASGPRSAILQTGALWAGASPARPQANNK